jgi:hypothetical protein
MIRGGCLTNSGTNLLISANSAEAASFSSEALSLYLMAR